MEVRALFRRFVWRGANIDDVTIHPSRGSRIKPTLKVCEHNWVAHASVALDTTPQIHDLKINVSDGAGNWLTIRLGLWIFSK